MSGWTLSSYKQCVKAAALNLIKYVKGLIAVHLKVIDAKSCIFVFLLDSFFVVFDKTRQI